MATFDAIKDEWKNVKAALKVFEKSLMQAARDSIHAKSSAGHVSDISAEECMAAIGFDAQCEEDEKKRKAKKKEEE